jgi:nucleoside-diphosphate-sugar epimerase
MLTYQAIKNKKITVFGGNQIRPNIHIDDLLEIYMMFFSTDKKFNGVYNAGFENMSILEIAKKIQLQTSCKIIKIKDTEDIRSYRVNSSKLMSLGYAPKKNVDIAIDEINKFYKNKINKVHSSSFSVKWLKKII